jgi:hypothetical protein
MVTVGTHWERMENYVGTIWEHRGSIWIFSAFYTLQNVIKLFISYVYTLQNFVNTLYYIVYKYTILYTIWIPIPYNIWYIVLCNKHTVYHSSCMGSVVAQLVAQHSGLILCIRLSFNNSYGTIIFLWEQYWEHWSNVSYLKRCFCSPNVAISLKCC